MLRRHTAIMALLTATLVACAPLRPRLDETPHWEPSPNFDERKPNLVIIHHTSDDTLDEALRTLTSPARKVSSHYLIGRDGTVVQLVSENARAWHAGKSWWSGFTDINSVSIGIELDNNGAEPFASVQIEALLSLLADLKQRYRIPMANFIGHADVAPNRKDDPSALFPWQALAKQGFGLWCEPPFQPAPAGIDLALALAALGYDPRTPASSVSAFRLHYLEGRSDTDPDTERALAYCLLNKKLAPEATP